MTPPPRNAWATAFAAQSQSDWEVYKILSAEPYIPVCHSLHYLQMACEKIAKAYRCRDTSAPLDDLLSRHVGFAKFMSSFLGSPSMKKAYGRRNAQRLVLTQVARTLAREIEKLAPAVDRSAFPENAEYPWLSGDEVVAPCSYRYPALSLLRTSGGRAVLNLVARAIHEFETIRT